MHIFWELPIQRFFMNFTTLMPWINYLYSFIHIPGTIAFLVWLYYYTITRNRTIQHRDGHVGGGAEGSPSGPALYEARRRTMAVCNLLAFVVFTIWPCMPPRLLSDPSYTGPVADAAKGYGFVDTVHGEKGAGSVWTQNKFCNQYGMSGSSGHSTRLTVHSCYAFPPFRLLSDDWTDHHDDSSGTQAPKIELDALAVFQQLASRSRTTYHTSI